MAPLTGLGMSIFFLLVYNAGIGGIGFLPEFGDGGYLSFLFPLAIVSLAMGSSSGAGQNLHNDMQSGYFRRMYMTPAPRWAFIAAPLLADGLSTLLMTGLLIAVGAIFGVKFQFGAISVIGILALSLLWGITLSGFSAGIMLRTGKPQGAQIVTNAVFPLIFLTTTFLPRELITSRWLVAISWGNPVTYVLEANRYLLAGTSPKYFLMIGIAVLSFGALSAILFALSGSKKALN
jgi:ABC-2 type transport system permease protein